MIRPDVRHLHWMIILASTLAVLGGLRGVVLNDNVNSRLASAYSLVHDGTWRIDRPHSDAPNFFEQNTVDKVKIGGAVYSTKPPLMPLAMAGQYWLMHNVLGWTLTPDADAKIAIQVMSLTFNVLPFLLTLVVFWRMLAFFLPEPRHRTLPLFALAFATQLPGFATSLNNHTPGVFFLLCALYFSLGLGLGKIKPSPVNFALFGLCGGLTFTFDMPMTLFIAAAGLYLFACFPKQAIMFAVPAMALPLVLHFGLMLYITGSPLPVQMRDTLYLYEGSYWRIPGGMDALNEPKGIYLFHSTFGRYGLFLLFPILLPGLWGFAESVLKRETPHRGYILAAGALSLAVFAYYILTTNNYGGAAYGFRWFIGLMPILLLMAVPVWRAPCGYLRAALITLMLAVSMYSAYDCHRNPWGANVEWTASPKLFGPSFVELE